MIEICCGSYEDALAASRGGAERIELNCALALGGLTPSVGCLRLVKKNTALKVISMVRPRGAGFCYTETEAEQMFEDARALLENGSDGLAFGFLTEDGEIDAERTGEMIRLIHSYDGREAVFHRAFDCTSNPRKAMRKLIELGADRVLTSGLRDKAEQGKELLRELNEEFGSEIEILAGSGVNASNARHIMEETGVVQVHSSCRCWVKDPTTRGEKVSYGFGAEPNGEAYDGVKEEFVRMLVELGI